MISRYDTILDSRIVKIEKYGFLVLQMGILKFCEKIKIMQKTRKF